MIAAQVYWLYPIPIGNAVVTLLSTLKQNSLCPGDGSATFTCTCTGRELVWIVNERLMSYNINARVGAVRSNAESDETAILLRKESLGDSGEFNWVSVLTIREKPRITEPTTVQCHNGSARLLQSDTFWPAVAGLLVN